MPRLLSALVALMLLAVPAGAGAVQTPQTNAPAGNSAIDEYLETVPSVTGSNGPRPPSSEGGSATGALTTAQRKRLEQAGPAGRQLASVVDATAPVAEAATAATAPARAGTKPHERTPAPPTAQGRSPVAEVLNAATGQSGGGDGGGMGVLLPAILLGSLLGVIALVAIRRRSVS
jgi:hypothetical protein